MPSRRAPGSSSGRRSATIETMSSIVSSTAIRSRGRSTRIEWSTPPPSPIAATPSESTATSTAMTTLRSATGAATGDGRPGLPSDAARCSRTRSALTSSPTSAPIALRVRPVRATSSDLDAGPCTCSSRRMIARLALRTVSLRTPAVPLAGEVAANALVTGCVIATWPPLRGTPSGGADPCSTGPETPSVCHLTRQTSSIGSTFPRRCSRVGSPSGSPWVLRRRGGGQRIQRVWRVPSGSTAQAAGVPHLPSYTSSPIGRRRPDRGGPPADRA
jgi:hypothetical protein